ncbi:MAG: NAD-glutamate dehydrogenase, partial [Pseudonocardiales bacterium]|nr:NAD-glutamate dehydrogenase [Pseudonocardiales bacterium]
GIIASHLESGRARVAGQTVVTVSALPTGATAVNIITDDVPYLVDSVRAELVRQGHDPSLLFHPLLVVERGTDGALVEVCDIDDNAQVPPRAITESWMYAQIAGCDAAEREQIATDLRRVIGDVHAAVEDAPESLALLASLAQLLETERGHFAGDTSAEAGALLRWLADGNFLVLGHACYTANDLTHPNRRSGDACPGNGVLREALPISPLELLPAFRSGAPLVIMKSPLISTVHKSANYDCVTVIEPEHDGLPSRVHVFLGLISTGGTDAMARVPLVRRRIAEVIARSGVRAQSHSARQLLSALRTVPRDELLEADAVDLLRVARLVMSRSEDGGVGVFARTHLNLDFVTVLVYFPADRFGPETRRKVADLVTASWEGTVVGREDRLVELGLARMAFLVAVRRGAVPTPDIAHVEGRIADITRRWGDDFADLLTLGMGADTAAALLRRYSGAFDEAYKQDFSAATAVRDVRALEALAAAQSGLVAAGQTMTADDELVFDLYDPGPDDPADRRLKIFRASTPLTLARVLPLLSLLGLQVLDESPYTVSLADGPPTWIYDFGLRLPSGVRLSEVRTADVVEALSQLWHGDVDEDGFMALVIQASLTSRQVLVLRAYAGYLRQAGTPYSQGYILQALNDNAAIARDLVELFESMFDPSEAAAANPAEVSERIEAALSDVASLDQDRILRALRTVIEATVRTTAYVDDAPAFAIKLDPTRIPDLPRPRPAHEIWVCSPRVEGVHLRFGAIARGGLRWSDRREDFRTEVLGLVKAQMVKNAVIVPVGAKGGFFAKRLPDPGVDRDAWLAEGIGCYRIFINSLLALTDNYAFDADGTRTVIPPQQVVRLDDDDPYLVVAADKGTATFSDIANSIAVERGYWLGDAFASGGSVGYDHKAMGITARGAWESVRHHFLGLGVDVQAQPVTAVGIGDMSGDVFGNGMLLSPQLLLVAAFDHRHIFLDPDPDAASSFAQRRRLFDLPRSSWADYDRELISAGGGVYSRTMKAIPISDQVRSRLGLAAGVVTLSPVELMRAILRAPVDLLWNGGIGTYVKASTESDVDAGDRANDPIRIDATDLRVRVVGEGGNLGLTQRARIEYARLGGHINTDAIDNSAGVDTSDHEVNIKILLDSRVAAGDIAVLERNAVLAAATDEVAHAVLRDNIEQNVLLGVEGRLSPLMIDVFRRMLYDLERHAQLDRRLEFLPLDRDLAARDGSGDGLTRPELAVIAAYTKIMLTSQLRESDLPDDPWFRRALVGYFPSSITAQFDGALDAHPLHREIITTCVVNDVVNNGGISFVYRAAEEQGTSVAQILRAYTVTREVFGLEAVWARIEALGESGAARAAQEIAYLEVRRLVDRATRWLLDNRFPISDVESEIARYQPVIADLAVQVPGLLRGVERDNLTAAAGRLIDEGVPEALALEVASMLTAFMLLDVVEIAHLQVEDSNPTAVADLYFALSDRFSVDSLLDRITALPRPDRWTALARSALRQDLYGALSAITRAVLQTTAHALPATVRISDWEAANSERVQRARSVVNEALSRDQVDLATLSVALRVLRGVS